MGFAFRKFPNVVAGDLCTSLSEGGLDPSGLGRALPALLRKTQPAV